MLSGRYLLMLLGKKYQSGVFGGDEVDPPAVQGQVASFGAGPCLITTVRLCPVSAGLEMHSLLVVSRWGGHTVPRVAIHQGCTPRVPVPLLPGVGGTTVHRGHPVVGSCSLGLQTFPQQLVPDHEAGSLCCCQRIYKREPWGKHK